MGLTGILANNNKQMMLPFVLDPNDYINQYDLFSSRTDLNDQVKPQIFSFRNEELKDKKSKYGLLNIIPTDRGMYVHDIGFKQLVSAYFRDVDNEPPEFMSLTKLIGLLPGILIREYTQDTRLETVFSLLKHVADGVSDGISMFNGENDINVAKMAYVGSYVANKLKDKGFWKDLISSIKEYNGDSGTYPYTKDTNTLIIKLIHALYYRMVGAVTTNIYILPNTSKLYMSGNGINGWPNGSPHGLDTSTKEFGILGKVLNFVGGNIKIVTEPIWNADFGGDGTTLEYEITLFNDTLQSAINNFIFVNTIIPQNMPMQYGVWQCPPSAYDVKIEGGLRLWMCKGDIKCTNKGVVRRPSVNLISQLINKHLNKGKNNPSKPNFGVDFINKNGIITIPDAYTLTMTFTSLLPNNFNNYLMLYAMNNNVTNLNTIQPAFYVGEPEKYIDNFYSLVYEKHKAYTPKEKEAAVPPTMDSNGNVINQGKPAKYNIEAAILDGKNDAG